MRRPLLAIDGAATNGCDISEITWIELPDGVREPFDVYVNGVPQPYGVD